MAMWLIKIDISDLLSDNDNNEEAIRVGKEVALRTRAAIAAVSSITDEDLNDILQCLEQTVTDVDEFNYQLERLFDWGDTGNRLFINTIPGLPLTPAFHGWR